MKWYHWGSGRRVGPPARIREKYSNGHRQVMIFVRGYRGMTFANSFSNSAQLYVMAVVSDCAAVRHHCAHVLRPINPIPGDIQQQLCLLRGVVVLGGVTRRLLG